MHLKKNVYIDLILQLKLMEGGLTAELSICSYLLDLGGYLIKKKSKEQTILQSKPQALNNSNFLKEF